MKRPAVYLIGTGPGDPSLITVRGLDCLRRADVVIHDPGISPQLLARARRDAEVIDVGHFVPLAFADWFRGKGEVGPAARPNVLLVDDSPFFLNMLTPVLQAAGYQVTAIVSAQEALAMLRDGRVFDVAITDIEMPDMNGFQFAEAVRSDPRTAELPIIALSSVVSAEAIDRGRKVGFYDYVAKFDRQGLIAALKEQADFGRAA